MINWLISLFRPARAVESEHPTPHITITDAALAALRPSLAPKINGRHEGIVYFIGATDGYSTLITSVFTPEATTTHGSFDVSSRSMASLVRFAADHGLQVVGQLHTHPQGAFHSDGDIEGTHIHYPGYVSIVIPNYGVALPDLSGADVLRYDASQGWQRYPIKDVTVVRSAAS